MSFANVAPILVTPTIVLAVGATVSYLASRSLKATRPQPQELMTPDGVPVTVNIAQPGRSRAVVLMIIGVAVTSVAALMFVVVGLFWNEFSDWGACNNSTNTTQGTQTCTDQFEHDVKSRLGQN